MGQRRVPKYIVYAILALASPIAAFLATLAYQAVADADFWAANTPKDNLAAAMMGAGEIIQLCFLTSIGGVIGIILAIISFRLWWRKRSKV